MQGRALERRTVPDGLWVGYGYQLVALNMPYRPNCQHSAVTGPSRAGERRKVPDGLWVGYGYQHGVCAITVVVLGLLACSLACALAR